MLLRPPCSTRTDTLFSYTTRFRAAAERRLRGHRRVLVGNLPALPDEKVGDRLPQPQIGDEVGAVGLDRQVAALQLVRSLGSCFHRRPPTPDRELDRLVVAGLEMQGRVVPDAARSAERRVGKEGDSECESR